MTTTAEHKPSVRRQPPPWLWGLYAVDSLLLIASGAIHLHLWDIAYRHVATLDVLFPVQTAASVLLAFGLLALRRQILVAAGLLLMAGTIAGFILARTVGIVGFKLTFFSGEAIAVLIIEAVAIVALAVTGWAMRRLA
jgi:hypothetical protein